MKSLLEDKEMAVEFFKAFLPESIIKKIDLSGLEHSSRSFISENLRETQADIVFTCPLKERKDEEVYLCLIVGEHKNKPDRYVSIQLGGYTFDGYRQQLSDKTQPLKVILPFLYYHGSGNWDPPYLRELFEYDVSAFLDYIPDFEMVFQNIQGYTDQEIRRLGNALLTSALLTQKYSDRPQMLVDRFNQIFSILGSWTDRNLFKSLIVVSGN